MPSGITKVGETQTFNVTNCNENLCFKQDLVYEKKEKKRIFRKSFKILILTFMKKIVHGAIGVNLEGTSVVCEGYGSTGYSEKCYRFTNSVWEEFVCIQPTFSETPFLYFKLNKQKKSLFMPLIIYLLH